MRQDDDGWQVAKLLVERHGAEAPVWAAMKAQQRLAAEDFKGGATWIGIVRAVDQLLCSAQAGPAH